MQNELKKKNLNQMMLAPFQSLSHKYLTEEKKEQIQKKLEEAGLDTKPEEYLKMKVAYPIIFTSVFLICTVFHDYYLFKVGVLISPLLYFYPDYLLKKRIKQAIEARKFELPEYLIPMLQLLKTHTTLEAVKKGADICRETSSTICVYTYSGIRNVCGFGSTIS